MKKLFLPVSIIALLLLPIGCNVQVMIQSMIEDTLAGLRANYTIEVIVTEGLNFTGRYAVLQAAYHSTEYVAFNSTS